jgi:hypothetical protein
MKLESSRQIFEDNSDTKFYENPSSWSRLPCGQRDGRSDMTKLIVTFCNFVNAPKDKHVRTRQASILKVQMLKMLLLCGL